MEQSKLLEALLHLMVNSQAQIQVLQDLLVDHLCQQDNLNDEASQALIDHVNTKTQEYQTAILAQLRNRYDSELGSIDDLLKGF